jgi:acyl-homoserine-lactone acylase
MTGIPAPRRAATRSRRGLALLLLAACAPHAPARPEAAPSGDAQSGGAQSAAARSGAADGDVARWERTAGRVTITRDDWGIAHVRGRTDADAVFGMMYAQAEDDFNRVETNYINAMGRLAEAEGESAIYRDLRMKLFIHPDSMKARYAASPPWLKALMDAWADGLNYYLHTHPTVRPRVITRFEPWMPLSFSEGSIGGDIESISLEALEAFYGDTTRAPSPAPAGRPGFAEPQGSNGIAIAPQNTVNGRALLLINPHTTFFFRSEVQATSEEGLNAYGAATWGQFFIYQGFNERVGWMHTTSGLDAVDEFLETVTERDGRLHYRYGSEERPLTTTTVTVPYRAAGGAMASRTFTVYKTHRGPIVREADGRWVSVALMQRPVEALSQSFLRTKARDYRSFREVVELKANSSNNTIFADASGNIAYFHPQFVPKRDDRFDYTRPVDGSDPATDWKGVHALDEAPHLLNPPNGWIQNTNNWPYSAAGANSPRRERFPRYMDAVGENPRGIHAMMVLRDRKDFTLDRLVAAAYDPYLPAFAELIPPLVEAHDRTPAASPLKARLAEQVALLRAWDYRWSVSSVPTSLAVFWGEELWGRVSGAAQDELMSTYAYMATRTTDEQKLQALAAASDRLAADFGSWRTPWGEINRFQRLTGAIVQPFSDAAPSLPVGFTSAQWGSLASFGARRYPGTKRYYGTGGNSFVAVVEFGDSVRARAVSAGGESGDPRSKHFNDQALRYSTGNLREVYFYPSQLEGHTEGVYRPGERR